MDLVGKTLSVLRPKDAELARQNIVDGEELLFCLVGKFNQCLVALDERLIVIKTGFMAGRTFGARITSFPYRDITSVEVSSGLTTGIIEVCTAGYGAAKQKSYWSAEADRDPMKLANCVPIAKASIPIYQPYLEALQDRIQQAKRGGRASQNSACTRDVAEEMLDRLERLQELRESGAVSDEEFTAAKRAILADMD